MKKLLVLLLSVLMFSSVAWATAPTINEAQYIQFTAADQETTVKFRIYTIVWASFTGSLIVDTNVLNLTDAAGTEILKLTATATNIGYVINFPKGINVVGLKAEDMTKGYLTVYGQRR